MNANEIINQAGIDRARIVETIQGTGLEANIRGLNLAIADSRNNYVLAFDDKRNSKGLWDIIKITPHHY
jgi:hypothetical protein